MPHAQIIVTRDAAAKMNSSGHGSRFNAQLQKVVVDVFRRRTGEVMDPATQVPIDSDVLSSKMPVGVFVHLGAFHTPTRAELREVMEADLRKWLSEWLNAGGGDIKTQLNLTIIGDGE
jgi:hypothetical protein